MRVQGKERGLVRALGSDTGPSPPSRLQEEPGRYCLWSDLLSCPADRPGWIVLNEWWPSVAKELSPGKVSGMVPDPEHHTGL